MANESHLSVLKQGVESWNQWREQDRNIKPDLSEADLPRVSLSGAALWGVDLSQANPRWANLSEADLWGGPDSNPHNRSLHRRSPQSRSVAELANLESTQILRMLRQRAAQ